MPIIRIPMVLNTDDPEQYQLYKFVKKLPNGGKRNSSSFLRTLVDREFQRQITTKSNVIKLKFD
jgi:hypothetical protein